MVSITMFTMALEILTSIYAYDKYGLVNN
jgi:hypothetical protein